MKNKDEIAKNWKKIVEAYNSTRTMTPDATAKKIVETLGYEQAIETFAVIAAIKIHDGRIYGANRDWMNSVSYNPEAAVRSRENPVIYAGLDDIHTAHINQIITVLRKMKEA